MNATRVIACPQCSESTSFPAYKCGSCRSRIIIPQPGPQSEFLASPAVIALVGGGRGGGKTFALKSDWLRYIHTPGSLGLIMRQKLVSAQAGLWDQMVKFYEGTGCIYRASPYHDFRWPCRQADCIHCASGDLKRCAHGAKLLMRFLGKRQQDYEQHKGPEYTWIGIEEANECEMSAIEFMLTCMRSTNGTRPRLRMTLNPDEEHPLAAWVAYYLDDDGYPMPERRGQVIYTMRSTKDDRRVFGETPEEVADLAESSPDRATSFAFIAALAKDNAALDAKEYGRMFANLTTEEREKLEDGCWKPTSVVGGMLSTDRWRTVTEPIGTITMRMRAWDFAATRPRRDFRSPDYTVGLRVDWDRHGRWYVHDPAAWREEPDEVERKFEETVMADGIHIIQAIEVDPAAGGKSLANSMGRRVRAVFCKCGRGGVAPCRCEAPRVVFTSPRTKEKLVTGQARAAGPKIAKLKPVARELRLGMSGDIPRTTEWTEDDEFPWSARGMILIDPTDDWTLHPYRDQGDHPPTLGALWRAHTHKFPAVKHDDGADALGIAHAAKALLDRPQPKGRLRLI